MVYISSDWPWTDTNSNRRTTGLTMTDCVDGGGERVLWRNYDGYLSIPFGTVKELLCNEIFITRMKKKTGTCQLKTKDIINMNG